MTHLANWFFLSIFKEDFSLFEIPAAAILNSEQWTMGNDDVSWLLARISALWIWENLVNMSQILPYNLELDQRICIKTRWRRRRRGRYNFKLRKCRSPSNMSLDRLWERCSVQPIEKASVYMWCKELTFFVKRWRYNVMQKGHLCSFLFIKEPYVSLSISELLKVK